MLLDVLPDVLPASVLESLERFFGVRDGRVTGLDGSIASGTGSAVSGGGLLLRGGRFVGVDDGLAVFFFFFVADGDGVLFGVVERVGRDVGVRSTADGDGFALFFSAWTQFGAG